MYCQLMSVVSIKVGQVGMVQLRYDIPMCEADRVIGLDGALLTAGVVFVSKVRWKSLSSINLQCVIQLCQLVIVNQLSCFSCFSWIQY